MDARKRILSTVMGTLALVVASAAAEAATSSASSAWGTIVWDDRTGGCSDAAHVSTAIARSVSISVEREPLFVRADVEAARVGRRRASLLLRRGGTIAVREVDAASCEELSRSAAVVVAMAYELGLDPTPANEPAPKAEADSAPESTDTPSPPPTVAPSPAESHDAGVTPRPARVTLRTQAALSIAGVVDAGTLPGVSSGLRGRLARDFGFVGIAIQGAFLPVAGRSVGDEGRVDVGYASGGLRVFESFQRGAWAFDVGAGLALAKFLGGEGPGVRREGTTSSAVIEASGEVAYRFGAHLRLRTSLDVASHVSGPTYTVATAATQTQWSPGAAFRLGLGPELTF